MLDLLVLLAVVVASSALTVALLVSTQGRRVSRAALATAESAQLVAEAAERVCVAAASLAQRRDGARWQVEAPTVRLRRSRPQG